MTVIKQQNHYCLEHRCLQSINAALTYYVSLTYFVECDIYI